MARGGEAGREGGFPAARLADEHHAGAVDVHSASVEHEFAEAAEGEG